MKKKQSAWGKLRQEARAKKGKKRAEHERKPLFVHDDQLRRRFRRHGFFIDHLVAYCKKNGFGPDRERELWMNILSLGHEHLESVQNAAKALGDLRDKRAVEPLIGAIKSAHPFARQDIVRALGEIGDRRAAKALAHVLERKTHESGFEVKREAVFALARMREDKPLKEVLLNENDAEVRRAAAIGLEQAKDKRETAAFLGKRLREEPNEDVRSHIATTIGKIKDPAGVPGIIESLAMRLNSLDLVEAMEKALRAIAFESIKGDRLATAKLEFAEKKLAGLSKGGKGILLYALATNAKLRENIPSGPEDKAHKMSYLINLREDVRNRRLEESVKILGLAKGQ